MKEILEELNTGVGGVIGSFVVGEGGKVVAQDVPDLIANSLPSISKTLFYFVDVTRQSMSLDKCTVDAENGRLICIPSEGWLLVAIVDTDVNLPLFKLMSNMTITKLLDLPSPPADSIGASTPSQPVEYGENYPVVQRVVEKGILQGAHVTLNLVDRRGRVIDTKKTPAIEGVYPGDTVEFYMVKRKMGEKKSLASYVVRDSLVVDYSKICDLYDKLFGVAAKRVSNLIGPKSRDRFRERAQIIMSTYPNLFDKLDFGDDGKPDINFIKERTGSVSGKDELVEALDEMLLSMFKTVKKIAGPKQEMRARKELDSMLDALEKEVDAKQELKAIDSIQQIKIERSGFLRS